MRQGLYVGKYFHYKLVVDVSDTNTVMEGEKSIHSRAKWEAF